jgi:hypothetical protein
MPDRVEADPPEELGGAVAELPGHERMRALMDRPTNEQE